jgi:hypothetical protein
MRTVPIPAEELKRNTWYYGVRCTCARFLALCEDLFRGRGSETHCVSSVPLAVECACGAVTHARLLRRFKAP